MGSCSGLSLILGFLRGWCFTLGISGTAVFRFSAWFREELPGKIGLHLLERTRGFVKPISETCIHARVVVGVAISRGSEKIFMLEKHKPGK